MAEDNEWISATEIASYVYCPESWRLEHGLRLEPGNRESRRKGELTHERWQNSERRSAWLIRLGFAGLVIAALMWLVQNAGVK